MSLACFILWILNRLIDTCIGCMQTLYIHSYILGKAGKKNSSTFKVPFKLKEETPVETNDGLTLAAILN